MSILITGIGTVGVACVEKFAAEGFDVVSLDIAPTPPRVKPILEEAEGRVKSVQGDVTDLSRIMEVVKQNDVEGIVHTVAITHRSAAGRLYPTAQLGVNAGGTFNILEVARVMDIDRVIYTSSGSVLGRISSEESTPIKETHPVNLNSPTSLYPVSKYIGELLMSSYHNIYGLETASCRLSWVRGVAECNPMDIGFFLQAVLKGKKIHEPSGSAIMADYSFNRDVANGIYLLYACKNLNTPPPNRLYNLTSGHVRQLSEIVDIINQIGPGEVQLGPGLSGKWLKFKDSIRKIPFDINRIQKLGYEPRPWKQVIEEWATWLKTHI